MSLTMIVQNDQTGETWEEHVADDDYVIICHGQCKVTSIVVHPSGTQQLTVKKLARVR